MVRFCVCVCGVRMFDYVKDMVVTSVAKSIMKSDCSSFLD